MNIILTTLVAILIFAILVLIHELGHFIVAKLANVKVNEFAIGMGPKLFGKQKGETLYSVRLIPLGGFCAMEGEDAECDDPRAFNNKKPYVRFIILVSGAFMNILLGFVLLFMLSVGNPYTVLPEVKSVVENSASSVAGLKDNDKILRANGKRIHIIEDLSWTISNNTKDNGELTLVVKSDSEKRTVTVIPQEDNGKLSYGINLKTRENNILNAFSNSVYKTFFYSGVIVDSFISMIKGDIPISQISGPVGIVSEIGTVVEETRTVGLEGFLNLISLTILLTINLGVFNLFPIPALDGGRILFVLYEMIRRKPVPAEREAVVHFVGFVLLIILSVFIAFKDVFMLWR